VIGDFEKFKEIIDNIDVVARCAPEHKYTIVTGLKQMGHVVAVTGDGTNDAPALRKANVGFAMGIAGTEYARQAADIILVDDNFGSIVKATIWGRGIYDNIQRFIQFQLTVNVVAVVTCIIGAITIQQSCLTAVQMLWVNMIMDSLASLALATEEPTDVVLKRKPQNPNEFIVNPLMFKHIFGQAFPQIVLLLIFMFYGENVFVEYEEDDDKVRHNPENHDFVCSGRYYHAEGGEDYKEYLSEYGPSRHFTYIFNIFIWFQLFNEINSRRIKDEINVFEGMKRSYMFAIIWFITAAVQVIIVQVGYWALRVNEYGLTVQQWFTCIAWGCVPLGWRFVLLLIPGLGRKSISEPAKSDSHIKESIHGSKRHFSSSYRIV
jgi:Ca2+ transporting ATPase